MISFIEYAVTKILWMDKIKIKFIPVGKNEKNKFAIFVLD